MTAYYNEFDPKAAAWLRELIKQGHIADGVVDERSIEDVKPNELSQFTQCHFFAGIGVWSYALRSAGWSDDRQVWTGSCPCQPFSAAGKGAGFADERHLWPAFHHLISQCQPDIVFGEQVASKDGLGWLDLVQADLEATGYASGAVDLCAAGVGAPHIRQRLWWIGERLADTKHERLEGGLQGFGQKSSQIQSWASGYDAGHSAVNGLADTDGNRRYKSLQSVSGGSSEWSGSGGITHGLGKTDNQRSQEHRGSGDIHLRQSYGKDQGRQHLDAGMDVRSPQQPSQTNGFWRDADWIFCRDGKWRPVESGTSPLVNGSAARVGRLRGYGNAIVAQAAQAFIESVM